MQLQSAGNFISTINLIPLDNNLRHNDNKSIQKVKVSSYCSSLSMINLENIKTLKRKNKNFFNPYISYILGKGAFGTVKYITVTNETAFPALLEKSFHKSVKSIFSKKTKAHLEFENNQKAGIESILYNKHSIIYKYKGESLYHLMNKSTKIFSGFLDADKKYNLTFQLLEQVNHLHEKGLSHLDIKPDNILINGIGSLSIIDYGSLIENFELPITEIHSPLNQGITFNYRAPEIFRGVTTGNCDTIVSKKLDSWTLGLVIYELFTEDKLMDTDIEIALISSKLDGDRSIVASHINKKIDNHVLSINIPDNIKKLLHDLLQVNPKNRITLKEAIEKHFPDQKKLTNKSLFCLYQENDKYCHKLSSLLLQKKQIYNNENAMNSIEQQIVETKQNLNAIKHEIETKLKRTTLYSC